MTQLDKIIRYANDCEVATLVTDGAIKTTYVNSAFSELSGYSEEEMIGMRPGAILRGPGSCEESRTRFHNGLRNLVPFEVKVKNYPKGSDKSYIAGIYVLPIRDSSKAAGTFYIALKCKLESPEEEILSDQEFSSALSTVIDLVTGCEE